MTTPTQTSAATSPKPIHRVNAPANSGLRIAPSLDDAAAGRAYVRSGQSGESVRQLQEQLRAKGYDVAVDGRFGPETERAVRAFQGDSGARVDGIVGPETMGKLRGTTPAPGPRQTTQDGIDRTPTPRQSTPAAPTEAERRSNPPPGTVRAGDLQRQADFERTRAGSTPVTLAPEGATEREKFEHYSRIIRANGGEVNPGGKPTVLGIRGMGRDGSRHETGSTRSYDDTFVVLTPDGRVREYSGATHPGQNRSTMSPDVTGDGQGDVGMIRAGNYTVVPNGNHGGAASYHVRTTSGSGSLAGWRDTNHDGRFSDAERAASEQRGDRLGGVLFHQGGPNAPRSVGCQTLAPNDYADFIGALGGPRASFSYTLVDANR